MNFWRRLGTMISAIGLMQSLPGKEVATSNGDVLGRASDIKLDLRQNRMWVLVKAESGWSTIPTERVALMGDGLIVLEG